jgi:hypothetical protein
MLHRIWDAIVWACTPRFEEGSDDFTGATLLDKEQAAIIQAARVADHRDAVDSEREIK